MKPETTVWETSALCVVLAGIAIQGPFEEWGVQWAIEEVCSQKAYRAAGSGWLVRLGIRRPDRDTRVVDVGWSRWEFVARGASESAVVKTAWVLLELTMRHELMEGFLYRGVRIFDPHQTVDELSMPHYQRLASKEGSA